MIDNSKGTTAEIKLRVMSGAKLGQRDGAMFALLDRRRESQIVFFEDPIEILDSNKLRLVHQMDTTDRFYRYRLALIGDGLRVFVDGTEIRSLRITEDVTRKEVLFGDSSSNPGENFTAQLAYITYSPHGAVAASNEEDDG